MKPSVIALLACTAALAACGAPSSSVPIPPSSPPPPPTAPAAASSSSDTSGETANQGIHTYKVTVAQGRPTGDCSLTGRTDETVGAVVQWDVRLNQDPQTGVPSDVEIYYVPDNGGMVGVGKRVAPGIYFEAGQKGGDNAEVVKLSPAGYDLTLYLNDRDINTYAATSGAPTCEHLVDQLVG